MWDTGSIRWVDWTLTNYSKFPEWGSALRFSIFPEINVSVCPCGYIVIQLDDLPWSRRVLVTVAQRHNDPEPHGPTPSALLTGSRPHGDPARRGRSAMGARAQPPGVSPPVTERTRAGSQARSPRAAGRLGGGRPEGLASAAVRGVCAALSPVRSRACVFPRRVAPLGLSFYRNPSLILAIIHFYG